MSLYDYADGDPINKIDADGRIATGFANGWNNGDGQLASGGEWNSAHYSNSIAGGIGWVPGAALGDINASTAKPLAFLAGGLIELGHLALTETSKAVGLNPQAVEAMPFLRTEMGIGRTLSIAGGATREYTAVAKSGMGRELVLHQDQVIINNYQRYYNDAWQQTVARFNAGEITIPQGQSWQTVLGQVTDATARARLKNFLQSEGIPEGAGTDVLINRWLRDPSGSGAYRIPDVRLMQTGTILDGTIGNKTPSSPQVQDFINFSGGDNVIIVKPTVGPGF